MSVSIYDVNGKLVERLIDNEYREAGDYNIEYRPSGASGVLFARVEAAGETKTAKILLLK